MLALLHTIPGDHQPSLLSLETYLAWCGWWVGLGILSSVGLGTVYLPGLVWLVGRPGHPQLCRAGHWATHFPPVPGASYSSCHHGSIRVWDHRLPLPTLPLTDHVPHHGGGHGGADDHLGDIVQGQGGSLLLGCWYCYWGVTSLLHGQGCKAVR